MKKLLHTLALLLAIPAGLSCNALADTLFESATMGATQQSGGYSIDDAQYLGVRFTLGSKTTITSVGGQLGAGGFGDGGIFVAIVKLASASALPVGAPFTSQEVVASKAVKITGKPATDVFVPLTVTLDPGVYGLIYGSGALGDPASGSGESYAGLMGNGNTDRGNGSYFFWRTNSWVNSAPVGLRFTVYGTPAGAPPQVLFVSSSSTLTSGDIAIRDRLVSDGYQPVIKSADTVATQDAAGRALVAISESSYSVLVGSKFRDVPVPVLTWEAYLFDDLGLTGQTKDTDFGYASSQSSLTITDPTHPLAAGFSGIQTIYTSPGTISWGKPNANADFVASVTGTPAKSVIFGYEAGAVMPGLTAPARRVGFVFNNSANEPSRATSAGWKLFDAAVAWAATPPLRVSVNFQPPRRARALRFPCGYGSCLREPRKRLELRLEHR